MDTGKVKWFNTTKGFGFITPDDGGRDLFVHYSDILMTGYRNLEEDQRVTYESVDGPKGPCAKSVNLADGSAVAAKAPVENTADATNE